MVVLCFDAILGKFEMNATIHWSIIQKMFINPIMEASVQ
jgi:hypothetical protein